MIKHTRIAGLLSILSLAFVAQAATAADMYTIDPAHTSIVFSVAHSGFSYTYGFFREAAGNYVLDKARPENSQFRLAIKAASLDTNNAKRDEHLRSADFFNVAQYPDITFESTRCAVSNTAEGIVYQLTGNLSIHGQTRQVNVNLRMLGEGPGPFKDQRSGFLCQIELKRSDFGMKELIDKNLVGDAVGITVSFEGSMQDPSTLPRQ